MVIFLGFFGFGGRGGGWIYVHMIHMTVFFLKGGVVENNLIVVVV